jgi:tetratricopeptide (TPR) repeat protein
MTNTEAHGLCPADKLQALIVQGDAGDGARRLDDLIAAYPGDARLQFLKGSQLAGRGDYRAARAAMRRAIDIAPDYVVARFQLGLLELSSGEPIAAQETWGPLHGLPRENFVRLFVEGLCHLIRDDFADAVRYLQDGIALNRENAPMNRDMQLVIDEIRLKQKNGQAGEPAASSVDLLLQQAALKSRKH